MSAFSSYSNIKQRNYLLLQGVCSPFFSKLGMCLQATGHRVHKINFNAGDVLYSSDLETINFRQPLTELIGFLKLIYQKFKITDQISFGDRRPIHVDAIACARQLGIRNHIFEEGYFRPYWVTLEQDGVNARSHLPKDADWYLKAALFLENSSEAGLLHPFKSAFWRRAMHDVIYHTAGSVNPLFFSSYQTHSNVTAPIEYAGYALRFPKIRLIKNSETKWIDRLIESRRPYFVFPLQLNSDAQVRDHPTLNDMQSLIKHVIQSFARHCTPETILVIKNHPLDTGCVRYSNMIDRLMNQFNLKNKIKYLETGDLNLLTAHAQGLVTLNSTAGMVALEQNCPVIALGDAVYNFKGLTNQTGLDNFWTSCLRPNPIVFQAFKRVVIRTTQINGGFYCPTGIDLAVKASIPVLTSSQSALDLLKQDIEADSCQA